MIYLYEYLTFLAETVTVVVAIAVIVSLVMGMSMRQQGQGSDGYLSITKLNERLRELRYAMEGALLPADVLKKKHKSEAKADTQARKAASQAHKNQTKEAASSGDALPDETTGRAYVLYFEGDVSASGVDNLRREITAVLTMAGGADEVVVCIESPGGMVHGYGLAASQLMRIRERGITLTAVVDKVAASGGYMMAAVANRVLAAPFALVGSIGVVAQVPNVHRLLKKNDVDVEVITAGKYKRTLTVLGENTDEGREKFTQELEDVHALFQEFVADHRPELDLDNVATGEAWYGKRALAMGLVDEITTSDEYLMQLCDAREVYAVQWKEPKKPLDRLLGKASALLDRVADVMPVWHR